MAVFKAGTSKTWHSVARLCTGDANYLTYMAVGWMVRV